MHSGGLLVVVEAVRRQRQFREYVQIPDATTPRFVTEDSPTIAAQPVPPLRLVRCTPLFVDPSTLVKASSNAPVTAQVDAESYLKDRKKLHNLRRAASGGRERGFDERGGCANGARRAATERVVGVEGARGCDLGLAAVWAQCSVAALSETSAVREQAGPTRARGTAN